MTKFKKVIAIMLALLMSFSSASVFAMAWDANELSNTELTIRTEFLKEVDGQWVTAEKVVPGQAVKARIYVGTNYYSNDSELLFHYDDSFFDVAYLDDELYEVSDVNTGITAQAMHSSSDKTIKVNVYTDTIYNEMFDVNTWLLEIPLTVKTSATGSGRIYAEQSDVRNKTNQFGYINVPAGPQGGSQENYNEYFEMSFWNVDSVVLDHPYVSVETTLTFKANGGEFADNGDTFETTGVIGTEVSIPPISKDGYHFRGWTDAANARPYYAAPETYPENDKTYFAYWDKTVTFVFDAIDGHFEDDGSSVKTFDELIPEESFTAPANPVKEGYTFLGWDKEVATTVPYAQSDDDFTVTYTAVYSLNVTMNFVSDGETLQSFNGYAGQDFGEAISNPTKTGYYFAGWEPTIPTKFPQETTNYVAKWEEKTYLVSFYVDNEYRGSTQVPFGKEVDLANPIAKAEYGYELGEWHKGSIDGEVFADKTPMPAENIKLYTAQSIITNVPATFLYEKGGDEVYQVTYSNYGELVVVPEAPTKAGYTFAGWSPEPGDADDVEGKTFFALWEPAEFNVSFYIYNENGEYDLYECYLVQNGDTIFVPAAPYTEGYSFKGWATTAGQTEGSSPEEISAIVMGSDELVFYEARKANGYKVNFDVDGGSAVETPVDVSFGSNVVLPETEKEGYTFLNWKDENGNTYTEDFAIPAIGEDGAEITLTAQWQINSYKLKFVNGVTSEVIAELDKDFNEAILPTETPDHPEIEGYYFTGWTEAPSRMPAQDVTVTAQYNKESYTVAFNSKGGSPVDGFTAEYGADITPPADSVKEGYEFLGWFETEESENSYVFGNKMPDFGDDGEIKTFVAKWAIKQYSITLMTDDTVYDTIVLNYGDAIELPPVPEKAGFTPAYWHKEGVNAPYAEFTMPAENVVLYAYWDVITDLQYEIVVHRMNEAGEYVETTYNRPGNLDDVITRDVVSEFVSAGAGFYIDEEKSDSSKTVVFEPKMQFHIYFNRVSSRFVTIVDGVENENGNVLFGAMVPEVETPTKVGYTFAGWTKDGAAFNIAGATMPAEDLILTATFTANKYNVMFDANGGEFVNEQSPVAVNVTFGEQIKAPVKNPVRYGYKFIGWGDFAEAREAIMLPVLDTVETVTYYAIWQVETYENAVTFKANGGQFAGGLNEAKVTATYLETVDVPEAPVKYGYEFKGWALTADATEFIALDENGKLPALDKDLDVDSLTYYAVYEARTFDVVFNANTGSFGEAETVNVPTAFNEKVVPPTAPSKVGYIFKGWATTNEEGAIISALDSEGKLPKLTTEETVTYYAVWTNADDTAYSVVVYTMGTDGEYDGGSTIPCSGTTGDQVAFDDVKPEIGEGLYFNVESSDSVKTIEADGSMVFKIYVDRKQSSLFVKSAPGAEAQFVANYYYGAAINAPEDAVKEGYNFDYWYLNDENVAFNFETEIMHTNDITLTAKFSPKAYEVTFNANGGKFAGDVEEATVSVDFDAQITEPEARPEKAGYEFKGWAESADENAPAVILPKLTTTDSVTYYAKWAVKGDTEYTVSIYTMNADGTYGNAVQIPQTGNCDSTVKYADVAHLVSVADGFTLNEEASDSEKMITADGRMIFNIYVDRNTYKAVFTNEYGFTGEVEALYGAAINAPEAPEVEGLYFVKWIDAKGNQPSTMPLDGASFTALYEAKTYSVNYYVNNKFVGAIWIEYGSVIPENGTYVVRDGYTLDGWYVGSIDGEKLQPNTTMSNASINLYATETAIEYKVTFDAMGGQFANGEGTFETTASLDNATITVPEEPTREGYIFVSWDRPVGDFDGAGDMTFKAVWEVDHNAYSAIFMQYNDEENPELGYQEYETIPLGIGDEIETPADPYVEGKVFLGWTTAEGATSPILSSEQINAMTMSNNDITFYAVFANDGPSRYNVVYKIYVMDVNGEYGSEPTRTENAVLTEGTVVNASDYPVDNGFTFDAERSSAPITVTENGMVVNVYIIRNKYTVNYYLGEEADAPVVYSEELYFGETIVLLSDERGAEFVANSDDEAIKYGKVFFGWDITEDCTTMPSHNIRVNAILNPAEFTIKFVNRIIDKNGNINEDEYTELTAYFGSKIEAYAEYEETLGCDFVKWVDENGNEVSFPFNINKDSEQVITVYAVNNLHYYAVKFFISDDATEPYYEVPGGLELDTDVNDYAPADPVREGYTFDGWYPDLGIVVETEEDNYYYAQWSINSYAYSFKYYDAEGNLQELKGGSAEFGSSLKDLAPDAPEAPEGMRFVGWSRTEGGSVVSNLGTISADEAQNIFYAKFVDASVSAIVKFWDYDGTNEHGPATGNLKEVTVIDCAAEYSSYVVDGAKLVLPEAPTLANYDFIGWFDADGKQWTEEDDAPATDLNLYAKYRRHVVGLIAKEGSTTVIERGETLNDLSAVETYTADSQWYVYGIKSRLSLNAFTENYIDVAGDGRVEITNIEGKRFVSTGVIVTVYDNITGEVVESFTVILFGDGDGDGRINSNDANIASEGVLSRWGIPGTAEFDHVRYKALNLDGNRRIKSKDVEIVEEASFSESSLDQTTGRQK